MIEKSKQAILLWISLLYVGSFWVGYPCWADSKIEKSTGQTIYVPVYSHIYIGDKEFPFYLTATLSIRNTDPKHSMTILEVNYHDSNGKLIKKYLDEPKVLNPLASTRYVIQESDKSGGSGASFIVKWKSDPPICFPIIESVMIGTRAQQGISFTSRGQIIADE